MIKRWHVDFTKTMFRSHQSLFALFLSSQTADMLEDMLKFSYTWLLIYPKRLFKVGFETSARKKDLITPHESQLT